MTPGVPTLGLLPCSWRTLASDLACAISFHAAGEKTPSDASVLFSTTVSGQSNLEGWRRRGQRAHHDPTATIDVWYADRAKSPLFTRRTGRLSHVAGGDTAADLRGTGYRPGRAIRALGADRHRPRDSTELV